MICSRPLLERCKHERNPLKLMFCSCADGGRRGCAASCWRDALTKNADYLELIMQLPLPRSCPAGGLRRRRQGNGCAASCWRDALKKNANQLKISCNIPYP